MKEEELDHEVASHLIQPRHALKVLDGLGGDVVEVDEVSGSVHQREEQGRARADLVELRQAQIVG